MKTEQEINEILADTKKDMAEAIPQLIKAINDEDWTEVVQYCNGLIVGTCVINTAVGFLEG